MRNKKLVILIWTLSMAFGIIGCACAEPMSLATALIISSGIAAGGGILGGLLGRSGDKEETTRDTYTKGTQTTTTEAPIWVAGPSPEQYPEYAESKAARQTWYNQLTAMGQDPNYGAIAPNWDEIWNEASKKVNQYYWGGAGGQAGLADKIKSSAAARGVSQSPALEQQLTQMGYQQAADLGTMATEQATQKAQFAETGRQNYLSQLQAMTGVTPSYYQPAGTFYTPATTTRTEGTNLMNMLSPTTSDTGSLIADLGSAGGNLVMQSAQNAQLEQALKQILSQNQNYGASDLLGNANYSFGGQNYNLLSYF